MSALKKAAGYSADCGAVDEDGAFFEVAGLRPYEHDIAPSAVVRLQEEADKDLAGEDWVLVDGFEFTK